MRHPHHLLSSEHLLTLILAVVLGVLPFSAVYAQDSDVGPIRQMIQIAADNGGIGHTEELNALKQQIEALPKPARGDKQAARTANDKGLAAFNAKQYDQAKQYFLAGRQADPGDVEIADNLGLTYLKLGDLPQARKTLAAAIRLSPGRAAAWANLAEYFALQGKSQQAVACYALTFHFSQNQDKTRRFLQQQAAADDPKVRQAVQQALQLSLIQGSGGTVAAAPAEDSLDVPLQPAAPASRSLPTAALPVAAPPAAPPVAALPVVAPPAAPPIATPPVTAPAAPSAPPPVAPVASSPIPSSLLPPAANNAAAPTPSGDAAASTGNDDIVEVVAQGMGTDQSSALSNAYSNAVQQALGLYVDAETMVQNDQIVRDQILTYSKGFIQKMDIVSQNQANGLFQVNIRAQVKRQKLLEQAKANNISLKKVEGASLHAQVVTQVKQEQDAKALLTKALSPFTGVTLYRVELIGEPKIVKKDEANATLSYPVNLYVDETAYNKAVRDLTDVLDKIAAKKDEEIGEYTPSKENNYSQVKYLEARFSTNPTQLKDKVAYKYKEDRDITTIAIMAWKDKSFTKSKWLFYCLSSNNLPFEQIKIPSYNDYKIVVNLSLLNMENELVALGKSNTDTIISNNGGKDSLYRPFFKSPDYIFKKYIILKSYFDTGTYTSPKPQINVEVTVSTQDLPTVQTAKLELKME